MKKLFKVLPLLAVFALVGCENYGTEVSATEGQKQLNAIKAEQEKATFEMPESLTFEFNATAKAKMGDETESGKFSIKSVVDFKNMCAYSYSSMPDEEDEKQWIFVDGSKIVYAEAYGDSKNYYEVSYADAAAAIEAFKGEEDIHAFLNSDFISEFTESITEGMAAQVGQGGSKTSYYSKGDGNLTVKQSYDLNQKDDKTKSSLVLKGEVVVTLDKYLLSTVKMDIKFSMKSGTAGEALGLNFDMDMSIKGTGSLKVGGTATKPNLSGFKNGNQQ